MSDFVLVHDFVEYPGYFLVPESPRGVLVFVHGVGDHIGRYTHFAKYSAERGFAFYGIDLPGHGLSAGIRGQIGSEEEIFILLQELVRYAKAEQPELPLYMMGHSMGGLLVLTKRMKYDAKEVKAYIASSPWLELVRNGGPMMRKLAIALARLQPNLTMDNGIVPSMLYTPSPEIPDTASKDPLRHTRISASTAAQCFKWSEKVLSTANKPGKPFYLLHGSADPICSVQGSRKLARAAAECTYQEWANLKHETLNEASWREVADGILSWLDAQEPD